LDKQREKTTVRIATKPIFVEKLKLRNFPKH